MRPPAVFGRKRREDEGGETEAEENRAAEEERRDEKGQFGSPKNAPGFVWPTPM